MTLSRMIVFGIALCGLAACETTSDNAAYWREADSKCRYAPDPETRRTCIDTEIALMKEREARQAESIAAAQERAQRMEEEAIARGTPPENAKPAVDSGLRLPD